MSTNLQRQVAQIRSSHVSKVGFKTSQPSLFLSPKDAAGIDIEDILKIAINSLNALIQYDHRLRRYLEDLLHSSSLSVQRELLSQEVHQKSFMLRSLHHFCRKIDFLGINLIDS